MNHLCDLPNINTSGSDCIDDTDGSPRTHVLALNAYERDALDAFRRRYNSALAAGCGGKCGSSSGCSEEDDDGEEKKSQTERDESPTSKKQSTLVQPSYAIPPEQLPPSGLRPLDDVTLYRYLLADRLANGTFDPNASYQRLVAALKFRKKSNCDAIVRHISSSDIPPVIRKCQRLRVGIWAGVDKNRRPVVFERLGQFFSSGNAQRASHDEWLEYYLYFLEGHFHKMRESSRRSGRAVDRIVYFADFQGVVKSICNRKIWKVIPVLKELVKTVECHYPEVVDHITLFNVPRVASAAYNVIKGFLDPVTAEKIDIFAGVPYDRFRELMSDDVIPVEYGGKNKIDYPTG